MVVQINNVKFNESDRKWCDALFQFSDVYYPDYPSDSPYYMEYYYAKCNFYEYEWTTEVHINDSNTHVNISTPSLVVYFEALSENFINEYQQGRI